MEDIALDIIGVIRSESYLRWLKEIDTRHSGICSEYRVTFGWLWTHINHFDENVTAVSIIEWYFNKDKKRYATVIHSQGVDLGNGDGEVVFFLDRTKILIAVDWDWSLSVRSG